MSWRKWSDPERRREVCEEMAELASQRGDLAEAREEQARAEVWRAFAETDWTNPNPENGFYPGEDSAPIDPESWDHQRRMTAVALLRAHLTGGYGGTVPALWEPPENNPVPEHVPDPDWHKLRAEMAARSREIASRVVDQADKQAKAKPSLSVGVASKVYGGAGPAEGKADFFAANAVDPDLKPEVQARKLDAFADRARELAKLYADLADGLEENHD